MREKILSEAQKLEGPMTEALARLCRKPAVSPHNGGMGEEAKIHELEAIISELGLKNISLKIERVDDAKSPTGNRPSLFLECPGKKAQRLCILTHIDVVPEGDRSSWTLDPFNPEVRGSRLYGRGVSDNGTCLISSLFALKALQNGSHYGLEPLLERGLFKSDDLVVVPDSGNDAGDFIEIAEKAMWRLSFEVIGKQVHASLPHKGINACRVANMLAYEVDEALHKAFPQENKTFDPPFSSFEPTRRFANVPATNIIPGRERFEFDCRVLPEVSLDDAVEVVEKIRRDIEQRTGAKIILEVDRTDAATPTNPDDEICKLLVKNVREVLGIEPVTGGIGGGTFAALFRRKGIPAVVWSQECGGVAHQPDEFTEIKYLVNNAKVFALMMAE